MSSGNKIQHVVIIVKENHTFDNYFGTFPGADGARLAPAEKARPRAATWAGSATVGGSVRAQ